MRSLQIKKLLFKTSLCLSFILCTSIHALRAQEKSGSTSKDKDLDSSFEALSQDKSSETRSREFFDFNSKDITEIRFDGIEPTIYEKQGSALTAKVRSSSSALIVAFDSPRKLKRIAFKYRSTRKQPSYSATVEASKKGDDAALRLGLILRGEQRMIPFFAPSWVKKLAGVLKFPSGSLFYLSFGVAHPPSSKWVSPYSDSISNYAVPYDQTTGVVDIDVSKLSLEESIVGLWIMSDGDDTSDQYETRLSELIFE